MSTAIILPRSLSGTINVPSSKSFAHRSIICASLSEGRSVLDNVYFSDDVNATISVCTELGANIIKEGNKLFVDGVDAFKSSTVNLDCRESASTLRFLVPVVASKGINAKFCGRGKLPQRPINTYFEVLPEKNIECKKGESFIIETLGSLCPGTFSIPGDVSSQFISGLLLALPILKGDSKINITTHIESRQYIDMTVNTMSKFGVRVNKTDYGFEIPGNQIYKNCDYSIEGDFSQSAFFLAAAVLGGRVRIKNLNKDSLQPDKKIMRILKDFGAKVYWDGDDVIAENSETYGIEIDASQVPDLVPILAVIASLSRGTSRITNAKRLRIKESDRLKSITWSLRRLGADIVETDDGLLIKGVEGLKSCTVDSFNDHRIAMALSIASVRCDGKLVLKNAHSVDKSYPTFFKDFNKLGGSADVVDVG